MNQINTNVSSIKSNKSIFAYKNYRSFLSDWLKDRGFSYRAFISKYPDTISFIALAKMLSKGRGGDKERNDYRISPEALARLGKMIRLSEDELKRLILLRLENDADVLPGPQGNSFQQIMRVLVEENVQNNSSNPANKKDKTNKKNNSERGLLIEIFDILPVKQKVKILDEIILQAKIYASRQAGKAGVKTLQSLMQELNQWRDLGAP